jgi:hypothetical protein
MPDTRTSAGGGNGWLDQHFSQPFAAKEDNGMFFHLYLTSVSKYLGDNFSFGVQGSVQN